MSECNQKFMYLSSEHTGTVWAKVISTLNSMPKIRVTKCFKYSLYPLQGGKKPNKKQPTRISPERHIYFKLIVSNLKLMPKIGQETTKVHLCNECSRKREWQTPVQDIKLKLLKFRIRWMGVFTSVGTLKTGRTGQRGSSLLTISLRGKQQLPKTWL